MSFASQLWKLVVIEYKKAPLFTICFAHVWKKGRETHATKSGKSLIPVRTACAENRSVLHCHTLQIKLLVAGLPPISCIKFKLSRGSRVCNCLSSVGLSFDLILEIKSLWSDPILDALRIPNPNLASAMDGRNRWFQIKPQQTFCRLHIWNASLMKKWSDKNQAAWLCTLEGAESIQWLRMQMLGSHVDALQKVWQLILPLGNYCGLQPSDFSAFITYTE